MIAVYSIFFLNVYLSRPAIDNRLNPESFLSFIKHVPSYPLRGTIIGVANSLQIMIMERIYFSVAKNLTDYENHRSETQYEDALTSKVFTFTFLNAYAALAYTAFVRRVQANEPNAAGPPPANRYPRLFECENGNCMSDLRTQLSTIFLTRVLISNVQTVLIPYYSWLRDQRKKKAQAAQQEKRRRKRAEEMKKDQEEASSPDDTKQEETTEEARSSETPPADEVKVRELSPAEVQFRLDEYHVMLGPFRDYAELITILGFAVLFVGAFPLAPLMALVNAYVELRIDAWHIAIRSRRPWPTGAEDIGTWNVNSRAVFLLFFTQKKF